MRIGIDIDGVLTDSEKNMIDYGTKFCIENNLTYRVKPEKFDGDKVLGISRENEAKFWTKYLGRYIRETKPRDLAKEVIDKLKEERYEIYLITARDEWKNQKEKGVSMREDTKKWLDENGIYYDKLIFSEGGKLPYCVGNYIDVMIEDAPKFIKEVSRKIPVLCYHCTYNQYVKGRNITRVYSWYDIYYKIINNLYK